MADSIACSLETLILASPANHSHIHALLAVNRILYKAEKSPRSGLLAITLVLFKKFTISFIVVEKKSDIDRKERK
jgi:hypothetical protein